jgi:hypothetical protein
MSDKNTDDQSFENQSSDYDEAYEDDVTYTEDDSEQWSDDADLSDDEDSTADQTAPKKKKTSNLTIAIIMVVAVVGVFGFMALKGNNSAAPQPDAETKGAPTINADDAMTTPAAQAEQPNITDLKNQADETTQGDQTANIHPPTPAPVVAEPQQGLMDNPNLMGSNTNTKTPASPTDSQPAVVPTLPTTSAEPVAVLTPPEDVSAPPVADQQPVAQPSAVPSQEVVNAISPTVKPVSDFPTIDSIKKPDATPTPAMAGEGTVDAAVPATEAGHKSAELQSQIDAAQTKISMLEKKISDQAAELEAQKKVASKVAAQTSVSTSGISEADVAALKEHIADLEEKLAKKAEKPSKTIVADAAPAEEKDYVVNKPVVKKTPVVAKLKPILKQTWSLKSAGSSKAILSDKATGDLKTVRVGDVVSGLGRIVSISNSNSSWVVKGTLGSVSE